MEVDEGGGGYGFARRNNPARKKVGRRAAAHSAARTAPVSYTHPAQKPVWVWLLTGLLLGTGGTLLTASLWLPENENYPVATLEADDHLSERPDGVAAATVTAPSVPETTPSEPRSEPTSVVVRDIEGPATTSPVGEVLLGTDGAGDDLLDLPGDIDAADIEDAPDIEDALDVEDAPDVETGAARNETQQPTAAIDADTNGERAVDDEGSIKFQDPGQALTALVSETLPTETPAPPLLPDDRSRRSGPDLQDQVEPILPPSDDPAVAETATDLPVAALPDAGPAQDTVSPPETVEIEPADDTAEQELPPRIRQALRAARIEAQSAAGTEVRTGRLYRVQLAAVDNEAAAGIFWRELNERLPGIFADVEPIFDQRLVDERLFVRIWVGAFESRLDADGYCGWLKLKGQDCFVTRVSNL